MAEFTQGNEAPGVDSAGVVSDGIDELLNAEFAGRVQGWAIRGFRCLLDLGAVVDGSVPVRRVLGFLGVGVVELGAQLGDVVVHC